MKRVCPHCNQKEVVEKEIEIPVGRERFKTLAQACNVCGSYALTPQIQRKIDEWGAAFSKSFIELQPNLSDAVRACLDGEAKKYALNSTSLVRLFTIFYLKEARPHKNFAEIEEIVKNSEAADLMKNREKKPVSIPIRYGAFKLINRASKVLEISMPQIMEEAATFCVTLKHLDDTTELKQIIAKLDQFVEDHALAA
jgi:hypothetical protein